MQKMREKFAKKRYLSNLFLLSVGVILQMLKTQNARAWTWKGFCNHAQNSVISDIKDVDF